MEMQSWLLGSSGSRLFIFYLQKLVEFVRYIVLINTYSGFSSIFVRYKIIINKNRVRRPGYVK